MARHAHSVRNLWRARISAGAGAVFAGAALTQAILPWSLLSLAALFALLSIAIMAAVVAVASATCLFDRWIGLLLCIGLVVGPNLWSWPSEVLTASGTSELRIGILAQLFLLSGFAVLPISFARNMWRHDLTCLMIAVWLVLFFWGMIMLIWRMGDLMTQPTGEHGLRQLVFQLTSVTVLVTLLGTSVLMFFVNLARLLWQEFHL